MLRVAYRMGAVATATGLPARGNALVVTQVFLGDWKGRTAVSTILPSGLSRTASEVRWGSDAEREQTMSGFPTQRAMARGSGATSTAMRRATVRWRPMGSAAEFSCGLRSSPHFPVASECTD